MGEIESVLTQHPSVKQAVVTLYKNQDDERLIAYVVPSSEVSQIELRQFLQGKLPIYMVPYSYIMLEEFPFTPNRKIDRKALPIPTDYPRPAVRSLRGDSYTFQISPELTAAPKRLSQQSGCTLFMTLLAAFQTLLYRYTGNEDIVVGTSIANRNYPEI